MARRFCALATLVLLAGCSAMHGHRGALDDQEDAASDNAAAFLGYHGPVHEMGGPPASARPPGRSESHP